MLRRGVGTYLKPLGAPSREGLRPLPAVCWGRGARRASRAWCPRGARSARGLEAGTVDTQNTKGRCESTSKSSGGWAGVSKDREGIPASPHNPCRVGGVGAGQTSVVRSLCAATPSSPLPCQRLDGPGPKDPKPGGEFHGFEPLENQRCHCS